MTENSETKALRVLIDNTESWYTGYRCLAQVKRDEWVGADADELDGWCAWDRAVIDLANSAKEDFEDHIEDLTDEPLAGLHFGAGLVPAWVVTIIGWAVKEIQWEELAKGWLEGIDWPQPKESNFRR